MPQKMPHVALLIETSRSYCRGLLEGINQYITEHGPWSVFMELRALDSPPPPWLKDWHGDGILARSGGQAMANAIRAAGVPAVELRSTRLKHDFPFVGVDNRAVGQMVFEHLLERGFRSFGIYEIDTEDYFQERRDNFVETVTRAGYSCRVYRSPERGERTRRWEKHQDDVARWVAGLPKPVGLMACTDQLGFWLLDACKRADVAVPEQVAVVGVENDESLCMMSTPPLSSVRFNGKRTGYRAAQLLDQMMSGQRAPDEPVQIRPPGIVTRQSSDVMAIDDPAIARAVRIIRERACEGTTVAEVVRQLPISRRALEQGMQRVLGRSPKAEINRVQLDRVKELLAETDLTLQAIAAKTGFKYPQYLSEMFKKKLGQTPGDFRAMSR